MAAEIIIVYIPLAGLYLFLRALRYDRNNCKKKESNELETLKWHN
jgi:hypothetical protein